MAVNQTKTDVYTLVSEGEFVQITLRFSITGTAHITEITKGRPGHHYQEVLKLDFLDELIALKEVVDRAVEIAENAQEG
jgi:hypothetical protein